MIKIKKVLVLTDLSEYARHAREECIDLIVLTTHGRPGLIDYAIDWLK